jgi:hypothetical protein
MDKDPTEEYYERKQARADEVLPLSTTLFVVLVVGMTLTGLYHWLFG